MGNPRLLYVFPEPFPLRKARAVQVANTVSALAETSLAVDLAYVPVLGVDDPFEVYGLACPKNVRLVPLSRGLPPPFSRLRMHSNRLFLWRLRRWFGVQLKRGLAPQAVFARHVKLAAALLDAMPELPLIYEAHEVFSQPAPKLFALEKRVLKGAAVVIAITQGLANALKRHFGVEREFVVIPSATSLPDEVGHKNWKLAAGEIAYAGSFYDWKGVDDLIAAGQWLPGFRITLIGGDEKGVSRLRSHIHPGGADFSFAGHLTHAEVLERLKSSCIAVLPNRAGSVSEFTSPLKLFEYMASGCAVVASDLPVLREILAEDEAAWFQPGDPKGLADAIRRLAGDPVLAKNMGERLAERAKEYSWQARAGRLLQTVMAVTGSSPNENTRNES
jgi:glycosyltransferase involved in cell wall biosynthesis